MDVWRERNVPETKPSKVPAGVRIALIRRMYSFLRRKIRQPKNIVVGHDFSHHKNITRAAKWYLEKVGALNLHTEVQAELATAMLDSMKNEPRHGESAAKNAARLMEYHGLGQSDVSAVKNAILSHNRAKLKTGPKSNEDHLADALYFANRINALGCYGVFRCAAGLFDEPERLRLFKEAQRKSPEAAKQLRQRLFIDDLKLQIRIAVDYLDIGNQKVKSREYYPPEVLPALEARAKETMVFVEALEHRQPWAVEIADKFLGFAGKPYKLELNELIARFFPEYREAKRFKGKAMDFIGGEIE